MLFTWKTTIQWVRIALWCVIMEGLHLRQEGLLLFVFLIIKPLQISAEKSSLQYVP